MATLTIEGVPDRVVARLIGRAVAHGRCLNSEVILTLVRAVGASPPLAAEAPAAVAGSTPRGVPSPGACSPE